VIRNLEDQIRKAHEARNFGVAEQERKIDAAEADLEDIDMVRGFFGLPQQSEPKGEPDQPPEDTTAGDETQVIGGVGEDDTQVLRRPGPLADSEEYWDTRDERGQ
jgi:hypothetical protein